MRLTTADKTRLLYSGMLYLMSPFIFVYLLWRSRKAPAYRKRWAERLGWHTPPVSNVVWIHAVSVGETLAAIPLVRLVQKHFPAVKIVFTTTTPTGSDRVRATFGDGVYHVYAPYDLPGAVHRFIDDINPRLLVVMETEFWPNIFFQCGRRHIPIIVANARISEKSLQGYKRFAKLTEATLSHVTAFVAQSHKDAQRLLELGAAPRRVRVTGNLKYEMAVPEHILNRAQQLRSQFGRRPVWIAASTHRGEDAIILEVFEKLCRQWMDLLLVLVPRHPERFDEVAALCGERALSMVRRTGGEPVGHDTQIYLGDTMGDLMLLYAASDIAFVGGSMVPHGGQNMLEPAALAKPVIFGAYTDNFFDISERLLEAEGASRVENSEQLYEAVQALLSRPELQTRMGTNAAAVVASNRGALKSLFLLISPVLLQNASQAR